MATNLPCGLHGQVEMRRMLSALADFEFRPGRATPLVKLCEAGARYGWRDLEATSNPNLLTSVSPKAKASLTRSSTQPRTINPSLLRAGADELWPCHEFNRRPGRTD